MSIRICLSKTGEYWAIPSIGTPDGKYITISSDEELSANDACLYAANILREAAFKFEILSFSTKPYDTMTHNKINELFE